MANYQIKIKSISTLHEQGKRNYQEDAYFPKGNLLGQQLFMVCDGVGGSTRGDQASQQVTKYFPLYVQQHSEVYQDNEYLTDALRYTEEQLEQYIAKNPQYRGCSTTLTYLNFTEYGAVVGWIGDSRVYHIRKNKILYQTEDHSLVNRLLKHNIITPEEAINHPKRNVITRAISGGGEPTKIDSTILTDIQQGDYFMLCSDGILETISDEQLVKILRTSKTVESAKEKIKQLCVDKEQGSNDNFTMILLEVGRVKGKPKTPEILTAEIVEPIEAVPIAEPVVSGNRNWLKVFVVGMVALLIGVGWAWQSEMITLDALPFFSDKSSTDSTKIGKAKIAFGGIYVFEKDSINKKKSIKVDSMGAFQGNFALIKKDSLYGLVEKKDTTLFVKPSFNKTDLPTDTLLTTNKLIIQNDTLWQQDSLGKLIKPILDLKKAQKIK